MEEEIVILACYCFLRALALVVAKICHFNISKNYFIILAHYFTMYPTSHLLFSNFIIKIRYTTH